MKVGLFYLPSVGSREEMARGMAGLGDVLYLPHAQVTRSLELFATKVLPRFAA